MRDEPTATPEGGAQGETDDRPFGVIDIGSNSVRLVAYRNLTRHPPILFNEKAICGLGRMVGAAGRMDEQSMESAMSALRRFRLLCDDMRLSGIQVVATAAIRDAENGADFVDRIARDCGFDVRVLSGEDEAYYSALGVISAMPEASGLVGDLGGGSLELAHIHNGVVRRKVSLPIGPVRLAGQGIVTAEETKQIVKNALKSVSWLPEVEDQPLYVVGGSWRALLKVHMRDHGYPLPIIQEYGADAKEMQRYCRQLREVDAGNYPAAKPLSATRRKTLPAAALILQRVIKATKASEVIASSFGLREGLHFERLPATVKALDPFLDNCLHIARETGRFAEHADRLMAWIDPLFPEETARQRRMRYAACLLSDISWRGHPDYRAEKAMAEALYGSFVNVRHPERAFAGIALFACNGGPATSPFASVCRSLLTAEELASATLVGHALRLGQRLSGGTSQPLINSRLEVDEKTVALVLQGTEGALAGDAVTRRLETVSRLVGRDYKVQLEN